MLKKLINRHFGIAAILLIAGAFSGAHAAGSAQDFLNAGKKAVNSQQYDTAIRHLNKATSGDGLSQRETAEAFYLRGVAFNKKGEPARSIADLTRAIFFKKLPPELKSKILVARAAAYRAVGLAERAEKDLRSAGAGATSIARVKTPASPLTTNRSQSQNTFRPVRREQPQARQRTVQKPAASTQGWGAMVQSTPQRQTNTFTSQPQRKVAQRESSNNFNRMFESESRPARQPSSRDTSGGQVKSANWNSNKQVASRSVSHTRNTGSSFSSGSIQRSSAGRYRLQLAAVSSENDAQEAWRRLVARHSSLLAGQSPDFQTVNLGNAKSVVRIQIGPFADKLQTLQLCNTFKEQGLDCFLVVR